MLEHLIEADGDAVELVPLRKSDLDHFLSGPDTFAGNWARATGFDASVGAVCLVPARGGELGQALVGLGDGEDPWAFAALPAKLPNRSWKVTGLPDGRDATWAALGWALATYSFTKFKTRNGRDWPSLVWPDAADRAAVERTAEATFLVRDLINTPSADMGPGELAAVAEDLAARFGASLKVTIGDGLLAENYPAIHAVGRAAAPHRQPRLIDLAWGDEDAPKVTVVGKGVCFDTGGLDLKASGNMKLMKKDMGGAAHALGLALMVMAAGLKVRLRVLVPAVENSVSADAMRPLDVLRTRKGVTVEVGNTDAEGRLILSDCLFEASRDKPDLLVDFATLTGAARTALGVDLPAMFSNDEQLAADLLKAGEEQAEPMWRLPLHKPYRRMLDSKVADLNNVSDGPHAGAITAALFLQEFVAPNVPWAHLDIFGWNPSPRPGRPDGGEAMGLRALFATIAARASR